MIAAAPHVGGARHDGTAVGCTRRTVRGVAGASGEVGQREAVRAIRDGVAVVVRDLWQLEQKQLRGAQEASKGAHTLQRGQQTLYKP